MLQGLQNQIQRAFGFFVLLIISISIGNRILFTHVHLLPNGTSITHAHPFSHDGDKKQPEQHTHSGAELFFLAALELWIALGAIIVFYASKQKAQTLSQYELPVIDTRHYFTSPGRSPPGLRINHDC